MFNENYAEKVGFAVGTGRCGTKFIGQAIALERGVSSVHERDPLNETFHRYCNWYGLPVDSEGFLNTKQLEIQQDLENHQFSFEASAHLSLSIRELYDRFGAKFLLLVRSPERVVNSYLRKGWYSQPAVRGNPDLAPSFQSSCPYFYYFLGRIMPSGDEFIRWNQMSRVGKLAWYWNTVNTRILQQFEAIPETHYRVEKLENITYSRYLSIAQFFGFQSTISQKMYDKLLLRPPNAKSGVPTIATWTASEISEFEAEVQPMAETLGYEYRVSHLPIPKPRRDSQGKLAWLKRQYQKLRLNGTEIDAGKKSKSLIK